MEVTGVKELKLDKSAFSIGPLDNSEELRTYWHSRTPAERWAAMEHMRRINYGEVAATGRLQRLFEVVERK